MLNDEKVDAFPLRSGTRQGWLITPLNNVLEVLDNTIRQERK